MRRILLQASVILGMSAACTERQRFEPPGGLFVADSARLGLEATKSIVARVDSSYFAGTLPLLGRTFMREEYAPNAQVVILSNTFWTEHFKGSPAIIGTSLSVDDVPRTIVGVMPAGVDQPKGVALWIPRE